MKKQLSKVMVVAVLIACSLFSISTFAQAGKHTPEERAKKMTDSLKSSLALTDEQYSKVYELNVNYVTKMQNMRQQTGSREEKMKSFKELRKTQKKDLSALLTPDQIAKLKTMQKEKSQEKKDHRRETKQSPQS